MIRKQADGRFRVVAESGRTLGTYDSRQAAERRLRQVEMFKHMRAAGTPPNPGGAKKTGG